MVSRVNLRSLAGKKVFLDDTPVKGITDSAYLCSALKQHILASGGILKDKREEADYIVELRTGAVGTDHHDVLFGVPAVNIPVGVAAVGVPSQIPEIPFVKRTDQRGVAKVSLFVYNRQTGRPLWQSGVIAEESRAKALWVFGAGPLQRGTIYKGTEFAGNRLNIPLVNFDEDAPGTRGKITVADEARFVEKEVEKDTVQSAPGTAPASTNAVQPTAANATPAATTGGTAAGGTAAGATAAVVPATHNAPAAASTGGEGNGTGAPSAPASSTPSAPQSTTAPSAAAAAAPSPKPSTPSGAAPLAPAVPTEELFRFPAIRSNERSASSPVLRLPPVSAEDEVPYDLAERPGDGLRR